MGDIFKEQIVKRKPSAVDTAKRVGLILAAAAIIFLSMLLVPSFLPFVALGAAFGAYYLFSFLNVEYEYIFTNGDLDIDCIYGRTRRKHIFSGDVKTDAVELMIHHTERGYDGQFNKAQVKRDCGSGVLDANSYRILANYKGKTMALIIEPNEALLAAMSPYLGMRKLIKRK